MADRSIQVRKLLLDRLAAALRRERPNAARKVDAMRENVFSYVKQHGAMWTRMLGRPVGKEPQLLSALLELDIGLDMFEFAVEQVETAADGRTRWVALQSSAVFHSATLQRAEAVAKRFGRAGLIDEVTARRLADEANSLRKQDPISKLRDQVAHTFGEDAHAFLRSPERDGLWNLLALKRVEGNPLDWIYTHARQDLSRALRDSARKRFGVTERFIRHLYDAIEKEMEARRS
ncbi:MAG: hypothetical protein EXR64_06120 [Dehalococcoidia bacterium]|nr:hypothetical protein [Dehalococcoidia bacterium]